MSKSLDRSGGATTTSVPRPAPASWLLAIAFGVALAAVIGAVAGALDHRGFWVVAGVYAVCVAGPTTAIGMLVFVRDPSAEDAHAEDNVERRWLERAASGALTDVVLASGVALTLMSVLGLGADGRGVLFVVLALAMGDAMVRYVVISRRES